MNEYDKQANDFLEKHNITMTVEHLGFFEHFEGEKDKRDVFNITLKRVNPDKSFTIRFGQCLAKSSKKNREIHETLKRQCLSLPTKANEDLCQKHYDKSLRHLSKISHKGYVEEPTAYDVLTCLTKFDPHAFESFCGDFGYDMDSRAAE